MENVSILQLQNLANILYEERNLSLRNKLQAWIEAKSIGHADLSSLAGMSQNSVIKDKILEWISDVTSPKPKFISVPDIPSQMEEHIPTITIPASENNIATTTEEILLTSTEPVEEITDTPVKKTRKKKTD